MRSFFLLLVFSYTLLHAHISPVDISSEKKIFLLQHSEILITQDELPIKALITKNQFTPFHKEHLNLGITKDFIYIHFILKNPTTKEISKALTVSSPIMEDLILYSENDLHTGRARGILHISEAHNTIPFYFQLTVPPQSVRNYYFKIHATYNPMDFALTLEDENTFLEQDRTLQALNLVLIGIVIALMLYSFFLSYYISDRSYFFYGLYLFTLIYQQMTYLGIIQIYFPRWFILFDLYIDIIKLTLIIITAALFAMHFLETKRYPYIHKVYQVIIIIVFLELLFLPAEETYSLVTVILSGTFFIFFNFFSGIYAYKQGLKQARLFVLGFSIVSLFYLMMILDALGFSSLMFYFHNALVWGTALEAFILSLAFADRYMILQNEKREAEQKIFYEAQHRTELIEKEVVKKTQELNRVLETKNLLIQEIHHRVKNNLQIILSIIRLQNIEVNDPKTREKLTDLEYRINAIAKTYTMLLNSDDLKEVNMDAYIETLLVDISESYDYINYKIDIITDIHATMPIKESVYIGLIINELVTNSYKHAFEDGIGSITIKLREEEKHYTLIVEDSGKGFEFDRKQTSLGLKLIHTLVEDQLEGTLEMKTNSHAKYIIKFSL
jgi:two-component sensor histidine kinase